MMQLGAQLQAANETKNEQEQSSTYKEECEKDLEGVEERIERNESRVSTHFFVRYIMYCGDGIIL